MTDTPSRILPLRWFLEAARTSTHSGLLPTAAFLLLPHKTPPCCLLSVHPSSKTNRGPRGVASKSIFFGSVVSREMNSKSLRRAVWVACSPPGQVGAHREGGTGTAARPTFLHDPTPGTVLHIWVPLTSSPLISTYIKHI